MSSTSPFCTSGKCSLLLLRYVTPSQVPDCHSSALGVSLDGSTNLIVTLDPPASQVMHSDSEHLAQAVALTSLEGPVAVVYCHANYVHIPMSRTRLPRLRYRTVL